MATWHHSGYLGQLLSSDEGGLVDCVPLLQVMDSRAHSEAGTWLMVKCIGRVRMTRLGLDSHSVCCEIAPFRTQKARASEAAAACLGATDRLRKSLLENIVALHDQCWELSRRLDALEQDAAPSYASGEWRPALDECRIEWGHQSWVPQFEDTLHASVHSRRQVLLQRGMDEAPAAHLEDLHALWGVGDEDQANELVLAFAACSSLPRACRLGTMRCGDPADAERLFAVKRGLGARKQALRARVAIEQLGIENV
eukprot:78340-Prymnesium_polylepis.1